ncbi:hypothetical protein [Paenibacillus amylolyticus]|uniref:hypothetical protein n=1 Tax=Paenibacillus amylolyticus TaxID=1451 RepID=UPI003EBA2D58
MKIGSLIVIQVQTLLQLELIAQFTAFAWRFPEFTLKFIAPLGPFKPAAKFPCTDYPADALKNSLSRMERELGLNLEQ